MTATTTDVLVPGAGQQLQRTIDWRGAFWVASGVPALVLFSIGGIAGTTGTLAFLVWTFSMMMGFIQSFTYAEIAGLFPNKSGGASIYGATAWLPYSQADRAAVGVVQLVRLVARCCRWAAPSRPPTSSTPLRRFPPSRRLLPKSWPTSRPMPG